MARVSVKPLDIGAFTRIHSGFRMTGLSGRFCFSGCRNFGASAVLSISVVIVEYVTAQAYILKGGAPALVKNVKHHQISLGTHDKGLCRP